MVAALGDTASSYATVKSWAAHFKMGKGGGGGGGSKLMTGVDNTHMQQLRKTCAQSRDG